MKLFVEKAREKLDNGEWTKRRVAAMVPSRLTKKEYKEVTGEEWVKPEPKEPTKSVRHYRNRKE